MYIWRHSSPTDGATKVRHSDFFHFVLLQVILGKIACTIYRAFWKVEWTADNLRQIGVLGAWKTLLWNVETGNFILCLASSVALWLWNAYILLYRWTRFSEQHLSDIFFIKSLRNDCPNLPTFYAPPIKFYNKCPYFSSHNKSLFFPELHNLIIRTFYPLELNFGKYSNTTCFKNRVCL